MQVKDEILPAGQIIDERSANLIQDSGYDSIEVRSALTCQTKRGICSKCYGVSLGFAASSNWRACWYCRCTIYGEPGTQLTLRTFHVGGTASRSEVDANMVQNQIV